MLQAVLLTSSLLLVAAMVASLIWLAAVRMREAEAASTNAPDDRA
jgi:hypothetical protein